MRRTGRKCRNGLWSACSCCFLQVFCPSHRHFGSVQHPINVPIHSKHLFIDRINSPLLCSLNPLLDFAKQCSITKEFFQNTLHVFRLVEKQYFMCGSAFTCPSVNAHLCAFRSSQVWNQLHTGEGFLYIFICVPAEGWVCAIFLSIR